MTVAITNLLESIFLICFNTWEISNLNLREYDLSINQLEHFRLLQHFGFSPLIPTDMGKMWLFQIMTKILTKIYGVYMN